MPPAPACAFASDNAAGAHPLVLEALVEANQGHALAYGEDRWTKRCEALFDELFGQPVPTLLAVNGTGANVLALAGLLNQAEAVLCSDWSHINVDETGAPERVLGAKLIPLRSVAGRVDLSPREHACWGSRQSASRPARRALARRRAPNGAPVTQSTRSARSSRPPMPVASECISTEHG